MSWFTQFVLVSLLRALFFVVDLFSFFIIIIIVLVCLVWFAWFGLVFFALFLFGLCLLISLRCVLSWFLCFDLCVC